MTDDQLREAAARALGWKRPLEVPGPQPWRSFDQAWCSPIKRGWRFENDAPPLDWTTAGALLELCASDAYKCVEIYADGSIYWRFQHRQGSFRTLTCRHVIEACVFTLRAVK